MNHDKPLPLASFLRLEQYRSRSNLGLVAWRQLSWRTLMIHFHPNALDTHRLGSPAKRILHAAIELGIEQGEGRPHRLSIEELLRLTGLPPAARPLMRDLLTECTKALGLLEPDDSEDDDVLEASCPVFQYLAVHNNEVVYRLFSPIYGLSAFELHHLLALKPAIAQSGLKVVTGQRAPSAAPVGFKPGHRGIGSGETSPGGAIEGSEDFDEPIDLTLAIQTLWRLAHEDGDLGAAYWTSVINLLTSASRMRMELRELRSRDKTSR